MKHASPQAFLKAEFQALAYGRPGAFDELWALMGATETAATRLEAAIREKRLNPHLSWRSFDRCGCAYGVVYEDKRMAALKMRAARAGSEWSDLEWFLLYREAPELILRAIALWRASNEIERHAA